MNLNKESKNLQNKENVQKLFDFKLSNLKRKKRQMIKVPKGVEYIDECYKTTKQIIKDDTKTKKKKKLFN